MKRSEAAPQRGAAARKTSRRRSREFALQGLYQWQLAHTDPDTIAAELTESEGFGHSDAAYFHELLGRAVRQAPLLETEITPCLDRPYAALSPIERGILLIAGYELMRRPEIPYRVIINEAVELAKQYGGTDGYKFVNGVLDKLVPRVRPWEDKRQ
jgi:N utilization substance protein B